MPSGFHSFCSYCGGPAFMGTLRPGSEIHSRCSLCVPRTCGHVIGVCEWTETLVPRERSLDVCSLTRALKVSVLGWDQSCWCSAHPPTDHRKGGVGLPLEKRHGEAFEGPKTIAEDKCFFDTCNMIWTSSGLYQEGGVCGHRCLRVDDVSHRIFSRSFRKYVTGVKVASPNLPKYLFGLPEIWDNNWQMCQNLFGSPQHNSLDGCAALELLRCFPVWITGMN